MREVERRLDGFVEDPRAAARLALPPMPRARRALVHQVAATYAVTTCSYGAEPRRRVDLFRGPGTGFPAVRLSEAAKLSPAELHRLQLAAAEAEPSVGGAPVLELEAVEASRLELRRLLASYDVEAVEVDARPSGPKAQRGARVTFASPEALAAARAGLGAGIRGAFAVAPPPPGRPSSEAGGVGGGGGPAANDAGAEATPEVEAFDDEGGGRPLTPEAGAVAPGGAGPVAQANPFALLEPSGSP